MQSVMNIPEGHRGFPAASYVSSTAPSYAPSASFVSATTCEPRLPSSRSEKPSFMIDDILSSKQHPIGEKNEDMMNERVHPPLPPPQQSPPQSIFSDSGAYHNSLGPFYKHPTPTPAYDINGFTYSALSPPAGAGTAATTAHLYALYHRPEYQMLPGQFTVFAQIGTKHVTCS